jgi:hypothetical protein
MNDMNQLEKQLRSWTPRRPSARVSRALFPDSQPAEYRPPIAMPLWLRAAAAACLMALVSMFWIARHADPLAGAAGGGSNVIATLSLLCANDEPGLPLPHAAVQVMDLSRSTYAISNVVLTRLQTAVGRMACERHTGPEWNIWSAATLDWTKASLSLSTTGSFLPVRTNVRQL